MNSLPTPTLALDQKIWRYMDLAKFTLMLTRQTLFFPCLTQLSDPFEGFMPRSHAEALTAVFDKSFFDPMMQMRAQFEAKSPAHAEFLDHTVAATRQKMSYGEIRKQFAVSCWHANDYESEAMWKIYSALGSGIAIQSTVERLRDVLTPHPGININRVFYEDFDTAPIVKGRQSYFLLYKRLSFEHEREVRATVLLQTPGEGLEIGCDLARLIISVYISPTADAVFRQAVEQLCSGVIRGQKFDVKPSSLLDPPGYDLNAIGEKI
jgi:hypothetical protein